MPRISPIDRVIGQRLREARVLRGLSQQALADVLNVTFQQIQKYEKGTNRVSAAALYRAATALDVPLLFFFEPAAEQELRHHAIPTLSRQGYEIAAIVDELPSGVRSSVVGMIRSLKERKPA